LKFAAVKALAISNLLELENQRKISRGDGFQGILNAIAGDVRSKHRKRLQRQREMESMNEALRQLAERKKFSEEQLDSYHNYVETAMNTMQKGKGYDSSKLGSSSTYICQTGKNDQFCPSPSSTFTFAIFRGLGSPLNLGLSCTLPRNYTIGEYFFRSINILQDSLTNSRSRCRRTSQASSIFL
jgi:hypothetical protein